MLLDAKKQTPLSKHHGDKFIRYFNNTFSIYLIINKIYHFPSYNRKIKEKMKKF